MTATYETTPMKPVVIFRALPPRETEDAAKLQMRLLFRCLDVT